VGRRKVSPEPRFEGEYTPRQVEAARRVLVDVGQVLASFGDAIVVVGGWVPDLLLPAQASAHIGSIDVDLALDAAKLADGRYAELLKLLLDTGRYEKGDKDFQLVSSVDLADGDAPVRVRWSSSRRMMWSSRRTIRNWWKASACSGFLRSQRHSQVR
jgi:hypothetical protein